MSTILSFFILWVAIKKDKYTITITPIIHTIKGGIKILNGKSNRLSKVFSFIMDILKKMETIKINIKKPNSKDFKLNIKLS